MKYTYGARIDDDSNAVTIIDETERSANTNGYINGEYVEFSSGGSSNFSTATVTVTTTTSAVDLEQSICCIESGELGEGSPPAICDISSSYGTQEASTTKTYNVPLYKGGCIWSISNDNVSISGNIVNLFGPAYYITGDCTITIS